MVKPDKEIKKIYGNLSADNLVKLSNSICDEEGISVELIYEDDKIKIIPLDKSVLCSQWNYEALTNNLSYSREKYSAEEQAIRF